MTEQERERFYNPNSKKSRQDEFLGRQTPDAAQLLFNSAQLLEFEVSLLGFESYQMKVRDISSEVLEQKNAEFIELFLNNLNFDKHNISVVKVNDGLLMVTAAMLEYDPKTLDISENTYEAYFFIAYEISDGSISFFEKSKLCMCSEHMHLTTDKITGRLYAFSPDYKTPVESNYITLVSLYVTQFKSYFGEDSVTFEAFQPIIHLDYEPVCRICQKEIVPRVFEEKSWLDEF